MKVLLQCMECLKENGLLGFQPVVVNVNDERFFRITCPKGHQSITVIQQPKHEILFELGMNALVDGYPREAVTSFASCLEIFYEFCIYQISLCKGVSKASLDIGWRHIAKQSERQLGAFVMLWLNHFESAPTLMSNKSRNFRNRVVHQGYIPHLDEALDFGDEIVSCISSNLKDMQHHLRDQLNTIFTSERISRSFFQTEQVTTQSIPTTIDWIELVRSSEKIDLRARMISIAQDKIIFQRSKT